MKIIDPSFEVYPGDLDQALMQRLELIARTCYKSENKIAPGTADVLIQKIIDRGHEAMLEHAVISVKFIVDRGVSHEIVRHRLAAYAQESTRYCNYANDKFGGEITVIRPVFWTSDAPEYKVWKRAMQLAEDAYMMLMEFGTPPQEARSVLPNSLKTEIWASYNPREWRYFFKMRDAEDAHPQMRQVTHPLHALFAEKYPVLFGSGAGS